MRFSLDVNPRLTWLPALDGLRGLAVIGVMLFHLKSKPWFPGGSLGVDVFFVLSGFLITTLLLQEWAATGTIRLRQFYMRRALRLLPAMFAFLTLYAFITLVVGGAFTGPQNPAAVAVLVVSSALYCVNWVAALGGQLPNSTSHLWSLAVEEQYYLVWPGLLLVMLRLGFRPGTIAILTLAIALLSAAMPYWYESASYRRLYYGTDFRLQALLLGSLGGQLYATGLIRPSTVSRKWFRVALLLALAFLGYWLFSLHHRSEFLFTGLYFPISVSGTIVVVACTYLRSGLAHKVLASKVLVYVGQRSYALYLWNLPIAYWLRSLEPVEHVIVAGALSFVAAEVSYRIVERPALRLKHHFAGAQAPASVAAPGTAAA